MLAGDGHDRARRRHDARPDRRSHRAVRAFCAGTGDGLCNVFAPHATAGVAIIETGARSDDDLVDALERLFPRDDRYRHAHGSPGSRRRPRAPRDRRPVGRRAGAATASRCSGCGRAWCSSTSTATTRAGTCASASWRADVTDRAPYLTSRLQGFGTTIFAEMSALAVATGSINLGQGFPDTDGPPEVLDAAVAAIRAGHNQYPPGPGHPRAARRDRRAPAPLVRPRRTTPTPRCSSPRARPRRSPPRCSRCASRATRSSRSSPTTTRTPRASRWPAPQRRVVQLRTPDYSLRRRRARGRGHAAHAAACCSTRRTTRPARCSRATSSTPIARALRRARPRSRSPTRSTSTSCSTASTCRSRRCPGMRERTVTISSGGKTFSCTGWKIGWVCAPRRARRRGAHRRSSSSPT